MTEFKAEEDEMADDPSRIVATRRAFLRSGAALLGTTGMGLPSADAIDVSGAQPRSSAVNLPSVRVHGDGHYLETSEGKPFFWLGDTAWQLIHATTREECSYYLATRARQGFSVVQAVVLSEFDGVAKPSALGLKPFLNDDVRRPDAAYFDRMVEIVDEAAARGLYVALVPAWGDKLTAPWGTGPRIFRNDNLPDARNYGRYLAEKVKTRSNVVWMLGGDRPPRLAGAHSEWIRDYGKQAGFPPDQDWTPIWRELAAGLAEGSAEKPLILYHPQGGPDSSSVFLHDESWLSVNGMQSGHGGGHDVAVWEAIARDYALTPAKPTLDLEPNYEDHPYNPWPAWDPATGYFRDYDVRKQVYRSVFAGACGVTYGHHAVWQFASARNGAMNHADRDWIDATQRPGGNQVGFLRKLLESRPYFSRIPDQSLIASGPKSDMESSAAEHPQATRDHDGSYAFIYLPLNDRAIVLDLSILKKPRFNVWWYDPRTGIATSAGQREGSAATDFRTPPYGPDWVLVLDDPERRYPPPGIPSTT